MNTVDQLKKILEDFPAKSTNPDELTRLHEFLQRMKDAGIAKTRDYDLPQPDTIGRTLTEVRREKNS